MAVAAAADCGLNPAFPAPIAADRGVESETGIEAFHGQYAEHVAAAFAEIDVHNGSLRGRN